MKSCSTCYYASAFAGDEDSNAPCSNCILYDQWVGMFDPLPPTEGVSLLPPGWYDRPLKQAKNAQIGGSHYKDMAIQPFEYITANKLGFAEGSVVKYVSRWRRKGGVEDLKKARHFLDLLIEATEKGVSDD